VQRDSASGKAGEEEVNVKDGGVKSEAAQGAHGHEENRNRQHIMTASDLQSRCEFPGVAARRGTWKEATSAASAIADAAQDVTVGNPSKAGKATKIANTVKSDRVLRRSTLTQRRQRQLSVAKHAHLK
jgi:hypothetical protein